MGRSKRPSHTRCQYVCISVYVEWKRHSCTRSSDRHTSVPMPRSEQASLLQGLLCSHSLLPAGLLHLRYTKQHSGFQQQRKHRTTDHPSKQFSTFELAVESSPQLLREVHTQRPLRKPHTSEYERKLPVGLGTNSTVASYGACWTHDRSDGATYNKPRSARSHISRQILRRRLSTISYQGRNRAIKTLPVGSGSGTRRILATTT